MVERGSGTARSLALTFDAGADRGYAREILDFLAREGIRASFGMTGRWAEANPDLVARMAESHVLLNHTYDHPHMETLSSAARWAQLARADDAVRAITGETMLPLFRPPFGAYNDQVRIDLAAVGYTYMIMWTVDSLGWQGLEPQQVADRCIDGAVPGAILLLHVGAQSTDWAALPQIIAGLRADGFSFVTVPEVIS